MTRRSLILSLLGVIAVILISLLLFRWRVIRQMLLRPRGRPLSPTYRADLFREEGRSRVVLVAGGSPRRLVYECLQRLGAEEKLRVAGKTILVKPNVVTGSRAPTTTNPDVVRAVCQWLKERGAATVLVGDMSRAMSLGTPTA